MKLLDVTILYESDAAHQVLSGVRVTEDSLYFGTSRVGFTSQSGAVVAVDRATGKERWRFDDGGALLPVYGTPAVEAGRVFTGEGLHKDAERRFFALDAATGKPAWPKPVLTASHTEGTALVAGGKAYFSAGDDGFYCVNAADGAPVWQLKGGEAAKLHVDTPAALGAGKLYVGSGYRTLAALCLDAATGEKLWQSPAPARSFGPPLLLGERVHYGLGTGNLVEDLSSEPEDGVAPETAAAGFVVALDARTGAEVWRRPLPKSVHTSLAGDATSVYAACKDGTLYALDRATGEVRWKRACGAAFAGGPALASYAGGALSLAIYAVTQDGTAVCLDPAGGQLHWTRDLAAQAGRPVEVFSTPALVDAAGGARRELYVGAMLTSVNTGAKAAAVFKLTDASGEGR